MPVYTSMQQQAGILPPMANITPAQVSAAIAQGGTGALYGQLVSQGSVGTSYGAGAIPTQLLQGFTNQGPMLQGPTGIMMPMLGAAANNPYGPQNPYAGLAAMGPYAGNPSIFTPLAPAPPPVYAGWQGHAAVPFAPRQIPAAFNTPYAGRLDQADATSDRAFYGAAATSGMIAHMGANFGAGAAGAALGMRFGLPGAVIGGMAGFAASEFSGFGAGVQNMFMNQVVSPFANTRAYASGIEHMSQHFIAGGPDVHARGFGFSHHASEAAAASLESLANSSSFRRQTFERFNQADVFKITQESAHSGLLDGTQSVAGMTSRVKDIAKSLSAFMELANEPDIQRALHTMGQMRSSGLNLVETNAAVNNGRNFARMAATSFQDMAAVGAAYGSQTYQSMGLTQGLGGMVGTANYGIARNSQLQNILSPQLMNLTGGAAGLGNMNNLLAGSILQQPMFAPGLMNARGGVDASSIRALLNGQLDTFSLTARGAGTLHTMAQNMGVEGLGLAIGLQPLLQDSIGRMIQSQGPFAQRNMEDGYIQSLMSRMGRHGTAGYVTLAMANGADRNQAITRGLELGDPNYWRGQRAQIETIRREDRARELRAEEAARPGAIDALGFASPTAAGVIRGVGDTYDHLRHGVHTFFHGDGLGPSSITTRLEDEERRAAIRGLNSSDVNAMFRRAANQREASGRTLGSGFGGGLLEARLRGGTGPFAHLDVLSRNVAGMFSDSLGMSSAARGSSLRDFAAGGRASSEILDTSMNDQVAAQQRVDSANVFGTGPDAARAQAEYSRRIAHIGGESAERVTGVNAAFRTAGLAITGRLGLPLDIGNALNTPAARGSQFEAAFVQTMLARGAGTEAELRARYREHQGNINPAVSVGTRAFQSPADRQRFQAARRAGEEVDARGARSGGSFVEQARRLSDAGWNEILGGEGGNQERREAFREIRRFAATVGAAGSELERVSQDYGTLDASYRAVINDSGSSREERARAERGLVELQTQLQGDARFTAEQRTQLAFGMGNAAGNMEGDSTDAQRRRRAGRDVINALGSRTGREAMSYLEAAQRKTATGDAVQTIDDGFRVMGIQSNVLGQVLQRRAGDIYDPERTRAALSTMSEERIRDLENEGQAGRQRAALIRRMRSGDTTEADDAWKELQEGASREGEGATAARTRAREAANSFVGRIGNFFSGRSVEEDTERRFREDWGQNSAATRRAGAQTANSVAAQNGARAAGIGGPEDQLAAAAASLQQAAADLRRSSEAGGMDALFGVR